MNNSAKTCFKANWYAIGHWDMLAKSTLLGTLGLLFVVYAVWSPKKVSKYCLPYCVFIRIIYLPALAGLNNVL